MKWVCNVEDYIQPSGQHRRMAKWICKHCGNEFVTGVASIKRGDTKSCGCLCKKANSKNNRERTRKRIFVGNKKFGMLTPISFADDYISPNGKHESQILCKCDCGNETIVQAKSLLRGATTSCGCRTTSIAAQNINDLLEKLHIPFISEYRIAKCYNPATKRALPFDFAIFDKNRENLICLIEYQGKQH